MAEARADAAELTFQPVAGGARVNNGDAAATSGAQLEEAVVNSPGARLGGRPPQPKGIPI